MLRDSGLLQQLERNAFAPNGEPMCLYGDHAYPLRVHLQAPFRMVVRNADIKKLYISHVLDRTANLPSNVELRMRSLEKGHFYFRPPS